MSGLVEIDNEAGQHIEVLPWRGKVYIDASKDDEGLDEFWFTPDEAQDFARAVSRAADEVLGADSMQKVDKVIP